MSNTEFFAFVSPRCTGRSKITLEYLQRKLDQRTDYINETTQAINEGRYADAERIHETYLATLILGGNG